MTRLEGKFKEYGMSCKKAGIATKAFFGIASALVVLLGSAAIKAIDNYVHRVDVAKENLNNITTELEDVESELQSIGRQIDDILAKDKISITDENNLKRLQAENDELERRKILLEAQEAEASEELNKTIESKYKEKYHSKTSGTMMLNHDEMDLFKDVERVDDTRWGSDRVYKDVYLQVQIDRAKELIALERQLTDEEQQELENIRSLAIEEGNALANMIEGYNAITPQQKEIKEGFEAIIADAAYIAETYPGTIMDITSRLNSKFAPNANITDGSSYMKEYGLDKQISAWIDTLSDEEKKIMLKCELEDASLDDLKKYLAEQLEDIAVVNYSLSDIFNLDDTKLGQISESIDKIQNAYTTLNDAIEEYNETGYFTIDTIQEVVALGSGYLDYLIDEEGNIRLDEESLKELTVARLRDMQAQTLQELASQVENIKNETDANNFAAQSYREKAESISMVTQELLKQKVALLDISAQEKQIVLDSAVAQMNQINTLFDSAVAGVYEDPKRGIGGSSSTSSTVSKTAETFDWIEKLIARIQRSITNLGKVVSGTYRKWSTRNNALAQEMAEVNNEINVQANAYSAYMAKANSIPLAEGYKALVRSGAYDISTITDDKLKEQIQEYEEWYNKALDAADAIEDLRANLAELAKTKFDNISSQYDAQISLITHNVSMLEGFVSQSETAGYMASEVYYQAMAEKQQENISQLQGKYYSLISSFDEAVKNGSIEKYSEDWYEMLSAINDVELELQDANTQLIEFNQTLQQLSWETFDRIQSYVSNIVSESEHLINMLDSYDLHTDSGAMTDKGLAVQGLHAVNYNTYMEQSLAYAEEMRKIEEEIANDPYDLELVDRRNELLKLQQDAISNAMSEKEAIRDLVSDGYDKMLESLNDTIAKRKELLNGMKDMYDYQNSISEKTSNISSLQKQLQAYSGDNSESAKATIQKIQLSLEEAQKDLEQTEYEKYLSDQEQMLDTLADQTEQWINSRLDNIDGLVAEAVDATNRNAETISNAIHEVANGYGYKISDTMETIWDYEENAIDGVVTIVSVYGDVLYGIGEELLTSNTGITNAITGGTTNVINAISGLNVSMQNMVNTLNNIATANKQSIAQAQNAAVSGQSNNNISTGTPSTSGQTTATSSGSGSNTVHGYKAMIGSEVIGYYTSKPAAEAALKKEINKRAEDEGKKAAASGGANATVLYNSTKNGVGNHLTSISSVKAYAKGTPSAKRGLHLVSESARGDEMILDNHGNAILAHGAQLYPFEGGEKVINADETKKILNSVFNPLNEQDFLGGMTKKSNYLSSYASGYSGGNISNDIQMNITLPNVTDYNSFVTQLQSDKRFEKIIQSMTTDRMLGKNSLNKHKF